MDLKKFFKNPCPVERFEKNLQFIELWVLTFPRKILVYGDLKRKQFHGAMERFEKILKKCYRFEKKIIKNPHI